MFKGKIPEIVRAPEPSDINWENCEKEFSFLRIIGIFAVTFIVIMVSIGIMAGVQAGQVALGNSSTSQPSMLLTILNAIASVVLVVINAVLWVVLTFLLDY